MKRPNAIAYMTAGGFFAGAGLGVLYAMVVAVLMSIGDEFLGPGMALFAAPFGLAFGAPVGLLLGFLSGFVMDWQVRRMSVPISEEAIQQFRQQVRWIAVILGGFGAAISFSTLVNVSALLLVPPIFISMFAANWVANRYINRLAEWGSGKAKRKEKSDHDTSARLQEQTTPPNTATTTDEPSARRQGRL